MNSISVFERIIKTSLRNIHLDKWDQLELLEVNCLASFAALSLRYSETNAPQILIPKSYSDALLTGVTGLPSLQVSTYEYVIHLLLV